MMATQCEKDLYGKNIEVLHREDDHTVLRVSNQNGEVLMSSFQVFPGICLVYDDVHTQQCAIDQTYKGDILEIMHCREGRIECEYGDSFFYLTPGDVVIRRRIGKRQESYFPGRHYHGITILIDVQSAPACLSCILDDVKVSPTALIGKFCSADSCFVMRAKPSLEHIFSELYSVQELIRKGYFKIKILELLLFLNGVDIERETLSQLCVPKSQVVLAKRVSRYLAEHMDSRVTTDQIAEHFAISPTLLKRSFKAVYGDSMYAFARTQKMQEAALLLRRTDATILDIAGQFGYDNGSKFAKAFRDVMGVSPNEYRLLENMI